MMTMPEIPYYEPSEQIDEFHTAINITFGELLDTRNGVDWTDPKWSWRDAAYDDEQYRRCCRKIENRYYDRTLGVLPMSRWLRHFHRIIDETMPMLKPLYKAIDENNGAILTSSDTYSKHRSVFSDFPATQLTEAQDYASNATDHQSETIVNGDYMEKAQRIINGEYVDVDIILLDKLDECFSCVITTNINCY